MDDQTNRAIEDIDALLASPLLKEETKRDLKSLRKMLVEKGVTENPEQDR